MQASFIESQSAEFFDRALKVLPGGVNSPVRAFKAVGGVPRFIASAEGARITDIDGQAYIDYVGAWGPMIHGHNHPVIRQAVIDAAQKGLSFGTPCMDEVLLAEWIVEHLPSIEQIRFVNSGTEATMTALRVARGFTGREKIIKFEGCYHGHSDGLLVQAGSGALTYGQPSSAGVPEGFAENTLVATYNDLSSVERLFKAFSHQIAGIIVEPIAGNANMILPAPGFLSGLRKLCDEYQAVLIFDEVMTGFRVHFEGAQGLYQIKPDLTCLGKVIGGGMPVGAVGGRQDIMAQLAPLGPVYQAGTLSGNPIAMSAGLAALKLLDKEDFVRLEKTAAQLITGLIHLGRKYALPIRGHYRGGMFGFFFNEAEKIDSLAVVMNSQAKQFNAFFQGMLAEGVYFAPSAFEAGFVSFAHTEQDIALTLAKADRVLASMVGKK